MKGQQGRERLPGTKVLHRCLAGSLLAVAEKVQGTLGRFHAPGEISVVLLRGPGCRYMVLSGLTDPGELRDLDEWKQAKLCSAFARTIQGRGLPLTRCGKKSARCVHMKLDTLGWGFQDLSVPSKGSF